MCMAGKSWTNYQKNPETKKKKDALTKKLSATPAKKKYRANLQAERRKRGIDGKGGGDLSHTKDNRLVREDPSKNRARNRSKK